MAGKVRWGILATGWIAEQLVQDLQMHGHTVAAVGSRSQHAANQFAVKFGIPKAHPGYEALCADPGVDAIYVATPHPLHAANAKLALSHGKHVLVEKAFTVNAREAQEVVDLAAANGLVVLEAMWTRFLPHMLRVREIVRSGLLGDIRSLTADHTQDLPDDPAHRLNALPLGGGALLDLGVYPISFTFDVLGAPKTIHAVGRLKQTGADGTVANTFTYENGAIAQTLSGSDTAGRNIATILGTEGRIEIDKVWYVPTTFRRYDARNEVVEEYVSNVEGRGMQYQATELERLVAAGLTAGEILPPAESVAIMAAMDEVRRQIGVRYPTE
jgi:predicted dehydrogenase